MDYAIEVRTLKAQPVVGIRAIARAEAIGTTLAALLPEVLAFLDQAGVEPAGPPYNRYHGAREQGIELEVGFPIGKQLPGNGRVIGSELPGGSAAVTVHLGEYAGLRQAYRALGMWLKAEGREMAGAPYELYWSGPADAPAPEQWKTEVIWPIRG